jgi:hypothetical protein
VGIEAAVVDAYLATAGLQRWKNERLPVGR